jgi:RimJ/RimL family protein N-acetyltransferase
MTAPNALEALWPLFGLSVHAPDLSLRYLTDELVAEVAQLAAEGVHDPVTMPFAQPWTDVAPPELLSNTLRYHWQLRAETTRGRWGLSFAVCAEDTVVGVCMLESRDFLASRTASTGSWLGRRYQGRGLGSEMRCAALALLFDGFGARAATTAAWHDNAPSLAITRRLGYRQTSTTRQARRDRTDTMLHFTLTSEQWRQTTTPPVRFGGLEPAREFLGLGRS